MILGAILVLAGALKGHQLLTDPSVGLATGFPRELLIGASAFELAFGCWLLGGLYRRLTRWMALAWFTSLAAVALAQAVGGAPSCACLGELHTHPWIMFTIDVASVVALWMWSPYDLPSRWRLLTALWMSLLPTAALLGLAIAPHRQTGVEEIDLIVNAQGERREHAFQQHNNSGMFVRASGDPSGRPASQGAAGGL